MVLSSMRSTIETMIRVNDVAPTSNVGSPCKERYMEGFVQLTSIADSGPSSARNGRKWRVSHDFHRCAPRR
jgi:hypothetical protein